MLALPTLCHPVVPLIGIRTGHFPWNMKVTVTLFSLDSSYHGSKHRNKKHLLFHRQRMNNFRNVPKALAITPDENQIL
jgi:hypothetical protein